MHVTPNPPTNGNNGDEWHYPINAEVYIPKADWFVPAHVPSAEAIEALVAQNKTQSARPRRLPNEQPEITGGWYRPPYAITIEIPDDPMQLPTQEFAVRSARSILEDLTLGDFEVEEYDLDKSISDAVDLGDILDFEAEPEIPPVESASFRPAPEGLNESGFRDAPELPLAAQLNVGAGGLRDNPQSTKGNKALTPDQVQSSQRLEVEVPARGFGGVVDQETPDLASIQPSTITEAAMSNQPHTQETSEIPANQNVTITMDGSPISQETPAPMATAPIPAAPVEPDQFTQIEQQVDVLRQQFRQGYITRPQLEAELKKLIALDKYGRWWTLGVDSNTWYRYQNNTWVADTPPRPKPALTDSAPASAASPSPVRGDYVRTETNVQTPVSAAGRTPTIPHQGAQPAIALDNYGMPLPQRVPEQDVDATMVNIRMAAGSDIAEPPSVDDYAYQQVYGDEYVDEDATRKPGDPNLQAYQGVSPEDAAAITMQRRTTDTDNIAENVGPTDEGLAKTVTPEDKLAQPDYSAALRKMDGKRLTRFAIYGGLATIIGGLGLALCGILGVMGYYFSTVNEYQDEIDNLNQDTLQFQTTRLYAQDPATGQYVEIGAFNTDIGQRTYVRLEDISPYVIHATIATEDETYYDNPGFSLPGIVRAIYTNFTSSGPRSGASTITQQLVKQVILGERLDQFDSQTARKLDEIMIATEVNRQYSKNEILELYLNQIYYGNQAYGIEAAAQTYFNKSARDLNLYEAAFLAGIPQAPARWDPVKNLHPSYPPETCKDPAYAQLPECLGVIGRMYGVIRLMTEANGNGCIQMEHQFNHDIIYDQNLNGTVLATRTIPAVQFDLSKPFCIKDEDVADFRVEEAIILASDFTPRGTTLAYPHYSLWVRDELERLFTEEQIAQGLNVYTTLNPILQAETQRIIIEHVNSVELNNGAVVVLDPQTGAVLAMVGSADYYNDAIDGQVNILLSPQQPGSSIKPVVYLTALEGNTEGYWTPSHIIWDVPTNINGYVPLNFRATSYSGPVTMRSALAQSLNIPPVRTLAEITIPPFEQKADLMGIRFPLQTPTEAGLSSALGAVEVYPLDMAAAYSAFANGGYRVQPFGITRVEDTFGNILYEANFDPQSTQVMTPQHAYLVNSILSDTNARRPTFGSVLDVSGRTIAVKTGTTQEARDIWTIGWTPEVLVTVWVGNTDDSAPKNQSLSSGTVSSPAWRQIINFALQTLDPNNTGLFQQPEGIVQTYVCYDTGATPAQGSDCGIGGGYFEVFWNQQPPPTSDQVSFFQTVEVERFSNLRADPTYCPNTTGNLYVQRSFIQTDDSTIIEWMKNESQGQQWAAARNIDPNALSTAPQGTCGPDYIQPIAQIGSPLQNQVLSGPVQITGTIRLPNYQKFEIQIAPAETGIFRTVYGSSQIYEPNSFLATWQTDFDQLTEAPYPNGSYILRLIGFAQNGETLSTDIPVVVQNIGIIQPQPQPPNTDAPPVIEGAPDTNQPFINQPTPTSPAALPTPTFDAPLSEPTPSN